MWLRTIGGVALILSSASLSAGIKINPTLLQIDDLKKQKSLTVNIESTGLAISRIYEVQAFKWQQNEKGEDILVEDKTLLFNPKTFVLKPESKQIVRIGLSQPNVNLQQQQAWKVAFKEVTPVDDESSLYFLFNFTVPFFVGKQMPLKLNASLEKINNSAYLNLNNIANSYARITEIILLDRNNKEIFKKELNKYVLSRGKIKVELGEININNEVKVRVKLEDQEGYLDFPVKI